MRLCFAVFLGAIACATGAAAQSETNLAAFKGLSALATLENSPAGKAALAANLKVTAAIQDGSAKQPGLSLFPEQQQQALRDAVSTTLNAHQLAEGLGTKLGAAYQASAVYSSADNGKTVKATHVSPAVQQAIAYAFRTSNSDSAVTKSLFGDGAMPDGKPAPAAVTIIREIKGVTDIFGRAYNLPMGSLGAGPRGNSRPFQTAPYLITYRGTNQFGFATNSMACLVGPGQDLRESSSFPSGHTTYGYTEATVLAILVPERYAEMIARGAEFGNSRIVLGAHYAMDVIGGRALALFDLAQLLANKPGYVGVERMGLTIDDYPKALAAARADLVKVLEAGCGGTMAVCAKQDQSRFADAGKVQAFYDSTQTYGLPVVHAANTGKVDVAKVAPEAGHLLTAAFPALSLDKANAILTATQGPGGGFLDNGSAFGVYSRIDLTRAAREAAKAR